jgi:hypothetical protein
VGGLSVPMHWWGENRALSQRRVVMELVYFVRPLSLSSLFRLMKRTILVGSKTVRFGPACPRLTSGRSKKSDVDLIKMVRFSKSNGS